MINRRTLLATMAATALVQSASKAFAADSLEVEIIALTHWPVENALKPILEMLKGYGDQISVTQMDADAADGKARMKSVGQTGHVPVLILINGEYQFTRNDGTDIELLNFPADAENPLNLNGSWNVGDVEFVINSLIGG